MMGICLTADFSVISDWLSLLCHKKMHDRKSTEVEQTRGCLLKMLKFNMEKKSIFGLQ